MGKLLSITVVTMLLVAGIEEPDDKTVWETLVIYFLVEAAMTKWLEALEEKTRWWYEWPYL